MLRRFLAGVLGLTLSCTGFAQNSSGYIIPGRFEKPNLDSDEGGLWALMDREERNLRRSPLAIKDEAIRRYLQDIICRLGGDHCPDIRVFLIRTPLFNANMAPNGMMQVWSGLLLRADNEAQLAAVLGHEIGHYLQRHSIERLRDIRSKSAVGQVLGLFGLVGALGQLAVVSSAYAYGRDHEREADRIGAQLMHRAGYSVAEAARIWANLEEETVAREGKDGAKSASLFATHPPTPERQATLEALAVSLPGGDAKQDALRQQVAPYLNEWLQDEIKRGQYNESIALLNRHIQQGHMPALMTFYRGEAYRLRAEAGDQDLALADYRAATSHTNPPPQAFRGQGLILRQQGKREEAIAALTRYLELAPQTPDAEFIKTYITELRS